MTDIDLLIEAARAAGNIGMKYFRQKPDVWTKEHDSPVSEADIAIDQYLQKVLLEARPDYGWLSEETEDDKARLTKDRIFVVDPIDGTRGFIQETENWVVSVAVVEAGRPIAGVLYGPVLERLYAAEKGKGATCNNVAINPAEGSELTEGEFAIPARIANRIQDRLQSQMTRAKHIHSLAYRIALVADGGLSGTIARPSAQDWDIAAADLILNEAGGMFTDLEGNLPTYNRASTRHEWLIAGGKLVQQPLKKAVIEAI